MLFIVLVCANALEAFLPIRNVSATFLRGHGCFWEKAELLLLQ